MGTTAWQLHTRLGEHQKSVVLAVLDQSGWAVLWTGRDIRSGHNRLSIRVASCGQTGAVRMKRPGRRAKAALDTGRRTTVFECSKLQK